jgi:hypothetical protein
VLQCPDIDLLCSPIAYFDRGLGGCAPSMTAAESVALAGKMWLNEDDTHTYLATGEQPGYREHVTTIGQTIAELRRNTVQEALRNFATWWMDLGMTGWFDDPAIWEEMKRLEVVDREMLEKPVPFHPEIAAVIDEAAMFRVAPGGAALSKAAVYEARRVFGRCGAPYGQYLLDDVAAGRVHAKLYVMLDPWDLSAEQRARLEQSTPGARWLWCDLKAGGPVLSADVLRAAARQAGVHLFTSVDCNVCANGPFLLLHGARDGPVEIDTGTAGEIRDALTDEVLGCGPRLTIPLAFGETRVLRMAAKP